MNATQRIIGLTTASLVLTLTPGCNDPGSGALTGAGLGAGLGALIGSTSGHAGQGALIGAMLGAYTGAVIGKINEDQQRALRQSAQGQHALYIVQYNDSYYAHRPPPPPPQIYYVQPATQVYVVPPPPQSYSAPAPQSNPAAPPPSQPQPAPAPAPAQATVPTVPAQGPAPLPVDDIKALSSAGVKPDVIISEIDQSKTVYTAQDIAAAQQANVDPSIIQHMQKTTG